MYTVEQTFVDLGKLNVSDFRTVGAHIPAELESKIKALCDAFAVASPEKRSEIISLVQPAFSFAFFWFAKEMAIQAVRENSQQRIIDGVRALLIENCTFDGRDSTVQLALIYHSAEKLVLRPDILFRSLVQTPNQGAPAVNL